MKTLISKAFRFRGYAVDFSYTWKNPNMSIGQKKEALVKELKFFSRGKVGSGTHFYLYTGLNDWRDGSSADVQRMYVILQPLVMAARSIGAKPILLSCGCCYHEQKKLLARKLRVAFRDRPPDEHRDLVYT